MLLGGAQKTNNFFTMLLTKTQILPLPIVPMSITSATLPGRSLGIATFTDMGTTYNFATNTTFDQWTVTIRTFQYVDYRMIKSWFEKIHSPMNGERSLPKDYKSICTLSQIDHVTGLPLTNFILKGIFPVKLGEIKFDETQGELVTFDVTFNIDDIIVL